MTVDFSRLFKVKNPWGTRAFLGTLGAASEEGWRYTRGESVPPAPVSVCWVQGSKTPGDVIHAGIGPLILSARVVDVLTDAGLRGWSTFPVEVFDGNGEKVPGFFGLVVVGRCGGIDLTRSAVVVRQFPGGWFPEFKGHYFDPASWDGSDLFMERPRPDGGTSAYMFCSDRARRVLRRARVSNLLYAPLDEYEQSTSNFTIGLSHLLPPDFSARVREAYARAGVEMPTSVAERL